MNGALWANGLLLASRGLGLDDSRIKNRSEHYTAMPSVMRMGSDDANCNRQTNPFDKETLRIHKALCPATTAVRQKQGWQ